MQHKIDTIKCVNCFYRPVAKCILNAKSVEPSNWCTDFVPTEKNVINKKAYLLAHPEEYTPEYKHLFTQSELNDMSMSLRG